MTTIICKPVSGRNFHKGVKNAKTAGGKYDPATQTWTISYDERTRTFTPDRQFLVEVARPMTAVEAHEALGAEAADGDIGMDNCDMLGG